MVSIVMPNHNQEKYVGAAIQSIMDQTFSDWELIIVDDASTDASWKVISAYEDPRIRCVRLPENGQVSNARNVGNDMCGGEYIAMMDSDDLWDPTKLETQVTYLEEHPEVDVCFTWLQVIDLEGRVVRDEKVESIFQEKDRSREAWTRYLLRTGNHFANDSALMRRRVMEDVGENDLALIQLHDFDIWLKVAERYELHVIQEPLMSYRKGEESLSSASRSNHNRLMLESAWLISRRIRCMEDDFFLRAFREDLVCPDATGAEMVCCEKALLLASDKLAVNCRTYAFDMLRDILADPEKRAVLKDKYHMDQRDVYRITGELTMHDEMLENDLRHLEKTLEYVNAKHRDEMQELENQLNLIKNSKVWRSTQFIRNLKSGAR